MEEEERVDMIKYDQPGSPDADMQLSLDDAGPHSDCTSTSTSSASNHPASSEQAEPSRRRASSVSIIDNIINSISSAATTADKSTSKGSELAVPTTTTSIPPNPSAIANPLQLGSLMELTPGVTAALRRMLEEKSRKENMVSRIKEAMGWPTVEPQVQSLFADEFLLALAEWIITHQQQALQLLQQCSVDQNKKEMEFHRKREGLVEKQQKELALLKRSQLDALASCDVQNTPHRKPLLLRQHEEELIKVTNRQREDLLIVDKKIVQALDQLLTAQQRSFNTAGIPGMKESSDATDIIRQMIIVDVIVRITSQAQS